MSVWVARAPGRLDVMGGIADYSGSLVLQWPIREATTVRVRLLPSDTLHVTSSGASGANRTIEVPLALVNRARPPYDELRAWFAESPDRHWAAYVAGVFGVLAGEAGVHFSQGAEIEVTSNIPEGKGVSSSAALEAATMTAVLGALAELGVSAAQDGPLTHRQQALLCQKAENLVVGAPCGVMDQMAVISGRAGHLMALLCQPAELQPPRLLPGVGLDLQRRVVGPGDAHPARHAHDYRGAERLARVRRLLLRRVPGVRHPAPFVVERQTGDVALARRDHSPVPVLAHH